MNFIADQKLFPEFEVSKLLLLESMFKEWSFHLEEKQLYTNYSVEDLVFDGFYPFFTNQKIKILYIGKESLGISGCNYINILFDAYKNNRVANKSINVVSNSFHNLMFRITYGINKDTPKWNDIPMASELTNDFGTEKGISFATMNISKFSNEATSWSSNWNLINSFLNESCNGKYNYFNKEIEIIDPDLIITMNISNQLQYLGEIENISNQEYSSLHRLNVNNKKINIINTRHFSYPRFHGDPLFFYQPIIKAIEEYKLL